MFIKTAAYGSENFYDQAVDKFNDKKFDDSKFLFHRNIVYNPKDAKSYLYLAKSYQSVSQLDSAMIYYDSIMYFTKSIAAAESKYHICEIAYERKNYELCESLIMELVQQKPSKATVLR